MKQIRRSPQRDAIYSYLCSVCSHPSAEEVHENVKTSIPRISLGTVYRDLAQLEEMGMIKTVACGGIVRYDAKTSAHCHLVCSGCGAVEDIDIDPSRFSDSAAKLYPGSIKSCDVIFYGKCTACSGRDVSS